MKKFKWDSIPEERLSETLTRRFYSGARITLARFFLKKGCFVPSHSHENEQMSMVLTGALRFDVEGRDVVVRAGETLHIPPGVPHSAEALEDTDALDAFAPARADWAEGRDAYLRAPAKGRKAARRSSPRRAAPSRSPRSAP